MSTRFLDKFGLEHFYKLIKDKLMSSEEKTKLENIDQAATRTPYIGCAGYDSEGERTDVYAPEHGILHINIEKPLTTEYVLMPSTGGPKKGAITIGASEATQSAAGMMSAADKTKLDGVYSEDSIKVVTASSGQININPGDAAVVTIPLPEADESNYRILGVVGYELSTTKFTISEIQPDKSGQWSVVCNIRNDETYKIAGRLTVHALLVKKS